MVRECFSLFERNRSWEKCYPSHSKAKLFSNTGLLNDELMKLHLTLFENTTHHISIINALGYKWKGLTSQETTEEPSLPDGGNLSRYLDELLHSCSVSIKNLGIYSETSSHYQKKTIEH